MNEATPLTVAELRDLMADLPDRCPVLVRTIVGGDLVTDDTPLSGIHVVTRADGHYLRLVPDPADVYGTRDLIDDGLAFREEVTAILDEHGDCIEGQPIHTVTDGECEDDCSGCCADDVMARLRALCTTPAEDAVTRDRSGVSSIARGVAE